MLASLFFFIFENLAVVGGMTFAFAPQRLRLSLALNLSLSLSLSLASYKHSHTHNSSRNAGVAAPAALPKQRQPAQCRSSRRASIAAFASASSSPPLLEVKGLEAVITATGQQILKGVDLTLRAGEVRKEKRKREKENGES